MYPSSVVLRCELYKPPFIHPQTNTPTIEPRPTKAQHKFEIVVNPCQKFCLFYSVPSVVGVQGVPPRLAVLPPPPVRSLSLSLDIIFNFIFLPSYSWCISWELCVRVVESIVRLGGSARPKHRLTVEPRSIIQPESHSSRTPTPPPRLLTASPKAG